jgi:Tol biopolymer transport system component
LFLSDRLGNKDGDLMVMDPDGSNVAVWSAGSRDWLNNQARIGHDLAPDGRYRVVVSEFKIDSFPDHKLDHYELFVVPTEEGGRPQQLTQLTELNGMSYDAVWSPVDYRIAFVSASSGGDEIYTIRPDGSELTRLTFNDWEWDKHPSWSPDGTQIVFWSNRETARRQIWIMNADGSGQRNLSNSEYNDWDPVWVR